MFKHIKPSQTQKAVTWIVIGLILLASLVFLGLTFTALSGCLIFFLAWQNEKETNKEETKRRHDLEDAMSVIAKDYDLEKMWKKKYGYTPGTLDESYDIRHAIHMGKVRSEMLADVLKKIGGDSNAK